MIDLTLQQLVLRLCALLLLVGVHGLTVAGMAAALGDRGPRQDGRLHLNPLVHLDLIGLVCGALFSVGWIKPVAIDPKSLRGGRIGLVAVTLAGAAAVIAAAMALHWLRPWLLPLLDDTFSAWAFALVQTFGQLAIWFALANLLPFPPFTGAHLIQALVPFAHGPIVRMHLYAALLMTALCATGVVTDLLAPAHRVMMQLALGE